MIIREVNPLHGLARANPFAVILAVLVDAALAALLIGAGMLSGIPQVTLAAIVCAVALSAGQAWTLITRGWSLGLLLSGLRLIDRVTGAPPGYRLRQAGSGWTVANLRRGRDPIAPILTAEQVLAPPFPMPPPMGAQLPIGMHMPAPAAPAAAPGPRTVTPHHAAPSAEQIAAVAGQMPAMMQTAYPAAAPAPQHAPAFAADPRYASHPILAHMSPSQIQPPGQAQPQPHTEPQSPSHTQTPSHPQAQSHAQAQSPAQTQSQHHDHARPSTPVQAPHTTPAPPAPPAPPLFRTPAAAPVHLPHASQPPPGHAHDSTERAAEAAETNATSEIAEFAEIAEAPPAAHQPAARRGGAVLVVDEQVRHPLGVLTVLGRNPAPSEEHTVIAVADLARTMSKTHLMIEQDVQGGLFATDLDSANGSRLQYPDGTIAAMPAHARCWVPMGATVLVEAHRLRFTSRLASQEVTS